MYVVLYFKQSLLVQVMLQRSWEKNGVFLFVNRQKKIKIHKNNRCVRKEESGNRRF